MAQSTIAHVTCWVMFIYWLLALKVFTFLRKSSLRSTMGKTTLISIVTINIERSYANCILQKSMDIIIDIFGKKKT